MKPQYETIELTKFRRKSDAFGGTQPYCIAFVYAQEGNFVVKGMSDDVTTYIGQRFPFCFYRYTFWKDGKCRASGFRSPQGLGLYFTPKQPDPNKRRFRWYVSMRTKEGWHSECMNFRRIPKKWLPAFDRALYAK